MVRFLIYSALSSVLIWGSYVKSPCSTVEKEIIRRYIGSSEGLTYPQSKNGNQSEVGTQVIKEASRSDEGEFEVNIKGVVLDKLSQTPVVILTTRDEVRFIPIWVGFGEAQAIDMEIRGITPPRPMTHDLLKNIITILGAKIEKVIITDIKNNTYYAEIVINDGNKTFQIDSRPSDAIALALRTKAPIFISKKILEVSVKIPEPQKEELILEKVGLLIQQITPELEEFFRTKGVVISDVKPKSPADGKLQRGDIIIAINGKNVQNQEGMKIVIEEIRKSKELNISILRHGKIHQVKIKSKQDNKD